MSESELLKRIAEPEVQNLELLAENERCREMPGLSKKNTTITLQQVEAPEQDDTDSTSTPSINKYSTPDEKIELFPPDD